MTLKKALCVFLAITFCVTPLSVFAQNQSSSQTEVHSDNFVILSELGIIDSGEYSDPLSKMTRGEFASLIIKSMGLEGAAGATAAKQLFSDVSAENPYAGCINLAHSLGLVNGTSDNKFEPDSHVYMEQAVTVTVKMLNFTPMAEAKGGYPTGYARVASEIDILTGVNMQNSEPASRKDIITLIANALFADIVTDNGIYNGDISYTITEGNTILTQYHGIMTGEGIVTANHEYSISGDKENYGYIRIGTDRLRTSSKTAVGSVGKLVEYYYKEDNGTPVLLTLIEKNNKTVNIKADDNYMFDYQTGTYTFYSSDKEYEFKIGSYYDVVYNKSLAEAQSDVNFEDILSPSNGEITLIDNNGDNIYEVVIIEEAKIMLLERYDPYTEKLYDKYDASYNISLQDYEEFSVCDSEGAVKALDDIKADAALMLYESADKKTLTITVSNRKITAEVTEISSDSIITNAGEFKISPSARKSDGVRLSVTYDFILDKYGEIVFFAESSDDNAGYILKIGKASDGLDSKVCVEILTSAGKDEIIPFADDVRVVKYTGQYRCSAESIKGKLMDELHSMYANTGFTEPRLYVMYKTNSEKQISTVILPMVISTYDEYENPPMDYSFFKLDYAIKEGANISSSMPYTAENRSAGLWMAFDEGCSIYYVPEYDNSSYDTKQLSVKPVSSLADDHEIPFDADFTGKSGQLEVYSLDNELRTVDAVVWVNEKAGESKFSRTYTNSIVLGISKVLKDGDAVTKIDVYQNNKIVTVYALDDTVLSPDKFKNVVMAGVSPKIPETRGPVCTGDIINYSLDADGFVSEIVLLYDSENHNITYGDAKFLDSGAEYRFTSGVVKDIFGDFGQFRLHTVSAGDYTNEVHLLSNYSRVYICDLDNEEVTVGSYTDISADDRIFVVSRYRVPREIFVFKGER